MISSLYLHVPFCRHLCNYCDFYKKKLQAGSQQWDDYESFLQASWDVLERKLESLDLSLAPLKTLYLGGGTPSLWGKRGADFLQQFFSRNKIILDKNCEATLEVDPGTCTFEDLEAFKAWGFNRFSVGAQALTPSMLQQLDRLHTKEEILTLLEWMKGKNYSLDLLIGAPEEKPRNVLQELDEFLDYRPTHFSLYILQARVGYPAKSRIPADEKIADEYLQVHQFLTQKGFEHYEVSNFCLPGKASVHNQRYWSAEPVLALGPNATGYLGVFETRESNVEKRGLRYQWKSSSAQFQEESLNIDQLLLEKLYLTLRSQKMWQVADFWNGPDASKMVFRWENLGYVETRGQENWTVTAKGWTILDSLVEESLRFLKSSKYL